jgi:hypothetical protein
MNNNYGKLGTGTVFTYHLLKLRRTKMTMISRKDTIPIADDGMTVPAVVAHVGE